MNARGLVFALFGDYLRYRGGQIRLRGLIALMDCFAVPESTVRVVVARLRKEGWLVSRRDGRETTYVLTEAGRRRLENGYSRIFERVTEPWDGQWHMVIYSVPETERALREQLRRRLYWLGFGPLSSSVWLSPHDRIDAVTAAFADRSVIRIDTFSARSGSARVDREMAARSWDLDGLNREYAELLERYRPRLDRYRAGQPRGRDALVERVQLVGYYRAFPPKDPDLPERLLPEGWAGRAAHAVFLEAHELLRDPAEAFVTELLAAVGGEPAEQPTR